MVKSKDNTFSVETAEDSSGFLLWQVTTLWQRKVRQVLEQYDLTHSQFVLLTNLHWFTVHNQEVTQILLSHHSKIDPMTTSAVLRTLQKKGLIKRQEHITDTRAKMLKITIKGKKLIKQAIITVEQTDRDFFALLGDRVKTLNEMLVELQKIPH
ncbi:MAG: MarR family transcriptional regulator [Tannerella sp.]|jgi:DNA-binding MarR family transcriptional regulator|nr:MarR family transcriptional regulator [Tannerella sp.]